MSMFCQKNSIVWLVLEVNLPMWVFHLKVFADCHSKVHVLTGVNLIEDIVECVSQLSGLPFYCDIPNYAFVWVKYHLPFFVPEYKVRLKYLEVCIRLNMSVQEAVVSV